MKIEIFIELIILLTSLFIAYQVYLYQEKYEINYECLYELKRRQELAYKNITLMINTS